VEHSSKEALEPLAVIFRLTDDEKNRTLQNGRTIFHNRVSWAQTYLKQAGLLHYPRRGIFRITDRGIKTLKQDPNRIDIQFLYQFPEFVEFSNRTKKNIVKEETTIPEKEMTPEEMMDTGHAIIQEKLNDELLSTVKKSTSSFFEKLVVDLVVSMGYGGSVKEAGRAIGTSGDEGIDGIIKEDLLGFDVIYLQAKKWEGSVGRPEIQKFAGALQGQRAKKGIFITTGKFSDEAQQYVSKIDSKIILIDGKRLSEYMSEHGVGVVSDRSYVIKKINSDYFDNL
jgi:restriction system protein